VCYVLAAGYLATSLLTNMPRGAVRLIRLPIYSKLELGSGPVFIASPCLFGFANDNGTARNLFVALGMVVLLVYFLADWYAQTCTADNNAAGMGVGGHRPAHSAQRPNGSTQKSPAPSLGTGFLFFR
jgi:hypothetical protein